MLRAGRVGTMAILSLIAAAGCVDSGLPDRNLPLETARERPFRYPVYDGSANIPPVTYAEQTWRAAGPPIDIPDRLLTRVSGATGAEAVYTLVTDAAPIRRLYVRTDSRYVPLAPTL